MRKDTQSPARERGVKRAIRRTVDRGFTNAALSFDTPGLGWGAAEYETRGCGLAAQAAPASCHVAGARLARIGHGIGTSWGYLDPGSCGDRGLPSTALLLLAAI